MTVLTSSSDIEADAALRARRYSSKSYVTSTPKGLAAWRPKIALINREIKSCKPQGAHIYTLEVA